MIGRCGILALGIIILAPNLIAASPFSKISGERLVHKPSGIVLPAKVGLFQLERTKTFRSDGRDVGAEYDVPLLIRGDVYVYPVGTYAKDLKNDFQTQQEAIRKFNKQLEFVSQSKSLLQQGGYNVNGLHADYQLTRELFGQQGRRCGSQFYVFQDGSWFVAYRFSYPLDKSDVAKKHIDKFMRQWQWRAR